MHNITSYWMTIDLILIPCSSYSQVVEYNRKPHERDPVKLDWVDTELKAEIQRVLVKLETGFLENVFVSLSPFLHGY